MKLKEIPNLMIAKSHAHGDGWNNALSLMSEREITLSREKLAKICCEYWQSIKNETFRVKWEDQPDSHKEYWYGLADAIIANLGTILESKNERD